MDIFLSRAATIYFQLIFKIFGSSFNFIISACDIRRIISHTGNLMINDRASIVLRLLTGLAMSGVEESLIMPEQGGIRSYLLRAIERESAAGRRRWTGRPRKGGARVWRRLKAPQCASRRRLRPA